MNENNNVEQMNTNINDNPKNVGSDKDKTRAILSVIVYAGILFIGASFIALLVAFFVAKRYDVEYMILMQVLAAPDVSDFQEFILEPYSVCQGFTNLISYFIVAIVVCLLLNRCLAEDFKKVKEKPGFFLSFSFISGILFLVITTFVSIIFGLFIDSSNNQETIEIIMHHGGAITMGISVVLLAPIVEELIFRKTIFIFMKKYGYIACYVVSIVLFTLPHMLSTDMSNIFTWILQCIPYALSGFLLCFIYHKSNENIYASIIVHMLNNILACILIFV